MTCDTFNKENYIKAKLPIEEQFQITTKELGLENIGLDVALVAQMDTSRSIHLCSKSMLEVDKNQMVNCVHLNFCKWSLT